MRLVVYANGEGDAQGRYCSVFLQIMEGEFDDELVWPFRGSANVILIDQSTRNPQNLKKTIEFSFNSPSGDVLTAIAFATPSLPLSPAFQQYLGSSLGLQAPASKFVGAYDQGSSGRPSKARKIAGRRVQERRPHKPLPSRARDLQKEGIREFAPLNCSGHSPFEKNDCSWFEVSVVHVHRGNECEVIGTSTYE